MFLITGGAGFIGFHLAKKLLKNGQLVHIIDNMNDFNYDSRIKYDRLNILKNNPNSRLLSFSKVDILDKKNTQELFRGVDTVIHLAAHVGIRKSSNYSEEYIKNNVIGFRNVLENCKKYKINKCFYASSSSVYNDNPNNILTKELDKSENPKNIYAFTKKSNELLAQTYSYLYGIKTFGFRFFSVYGTYGRPDMSYYKFTSSILNDNTILLSGTGNQTRDFTHVDDVVNAIIKIITANIDFQDDIINLGSECPIKIIDLIKILEKKCNKNAKIEFDDIYKEEVQHTGSNSSKAKEKYNITFNKNISNGMEEFIKWYKETSI